MCSLTATSTDFLSVSVQVFSIFFYGSIYMLPWVLREAGLEW